MSVEEALTAVELEAEREFCRRRESHGHEVTAWLYRLDRLILEVQAEMPCYVFAKGYTVTGEACDCPSCAARMKLKEVTA